MSGADFARRFEGLLGAARISAVVHAMTVNPVVLLAGDPGVGKSSIARGLSQRLGGCAGGTGACVRALATSRGLSLEAFNVVLAANPDEDVAIDALAAETVARGDVVVFESRLAGHLGRWLRGRGRVGILTLYLRCEPVEQALRLVQREGGTALRDAIAPLLQGITDGSLVACARTLRSHAVLAAAEIIERHASRTETDRGRMRDLYGVELDDADAYDAILDTTNASIDACAAQIAGLRRDLRCGSP